MNGKKKGYELMTMWKSDRRKDHAKKNPSIGSYRIHRYRCGGSCPGIFCQDRIPYDLRQWDDLIFWAVIIVVGGIGALLSGKLFGRR